MINVSYNVVLPLFNLNAIKNHEEKMNDRRKRGDTVAKYSLVLWKWIRLRRYLVRRQDYLWLFCF